MSRTLDFLEKNWERLMQSPDRRYYQQMRYIAEGGKLFRGKVSEPHFEEWLRQQEASNKDQGRIAKLKALAGDKGATKYERATARAMARKLEARL